MRRGLDVAVVRQVLWPQPFALVVYEQSATTVAVDREVRKSKTRKWWRFSFRTIFVVMTLAAVSVAIYQRCSRTGDENICPALIDHNHLEQMFEMRRPYVIEQRWWQMSKI